MNSHLESTTEGSEERKNQLKSVFKRMLNAPEMNTVIFAGDMNLRDKEVFLFYLKSFIHFNYTPTVQFMYFILLNMDL